MRSTTRARLAMCRQANGLPPVWPQQPADLLQKIRLIRSQAALASARSAVGEAIEPALDRAAKHLDLWDRKAPTHIETNSGSVNGGVSSGSSRCAGGGGGELIPQHLMKTHHFVMRQKEAEPAETGVQQAQEAAAIGAEFSPVARVDRTEHFCTVGRWRDWVICHPLPRRADLVKKLEQLFRRKGSLD